MRGEVVDGGGSQEIDPIGLFGAIRRRSQKTTHRDSEMLREFGIEGDVVVPGGQGRGSVVVVVVVVVGVVAIDVVVVIGAVVIGAVVSYCNWFNWWW